VHRLDQRAAALLAGLLALLRRLAADVSLDRVKRADPLQRFEGKRY
jgi:hypothetical protein